jgi:hypothetical protein
MELTRAVDIFKKIENKSEKCDGKTESRDEQQSILSHATANTPFTVLWIGVVVLQFNGWEWIGGRSSVM